MKRLIFITLLLWSIHPGIAQNLEVYDGYLDKLPVTFFLNIDNNDVSGYYIYKKYGQPILLKGDISDGKIELTEFSTASGKRDLKVSAKLSWNKSNSSNGQWISKSRSLPLRLTRKELSFDWKIFNNQVELVHTFSNKEIHKYPISLNMIYPSGGSKALFHNLVSSLLHSKVILNSIWDYFNQYAISAYQSYLADFSELRLPGIGYYSVEMVGKVVYLSDSLLCYQETGYAMSGGAHGQPLENYYAFDLLKSKRMTFNDIFKSNSEPVIAKIIYEKDKKEHNIESIIKNLDNFYLTNKGIGFIFNPYDIDCYACGTFEYFINFNEIKELLR